MSDISNHMPEASRAFVEFAQVLRRNNFAVSPDQTMGFIEAIGLLGPNSVEDIRRAAIAMLAIPRDRFGEFNALFDGFFLGRVMAVPAPAEEDESVEALDAGIGTQDIEIDSADDEETGDEASRAETLSHRTFPPRDASRVLTSFSRRLPGRLPLRRSQRWQRNRRGEGFDLRRNMRKALARDGEFFELFRRRRKLKQRPITLLLDVSGSMKEQSEEFLHLAHIVVQRSERAEVFTLGTRLTRVTKALQNRDRNAALADVAGLVADFDGGTRIGDALQAMLSVPRFAVCLRGAAVVVLSDGLERGDPGAMVDAVARISRSAWRLDWLSPLASSEDFEPRTEALRLSLGYFDSLAGAGNVEIVADHILSLASAPQRRRAA